MKLHRQNKRRNNKDALCYICGINKVRIDGKYINGDTCYGKDCNACNRKRHKLKVKYGITIEDYNKMFNSQKGYCRICGIHQSDLKRSLSVDHDHITLKVRGLLCTKCNLLLGHVKDDINLLKKSIEYLEK